MATYIFVQKGMDITRKSVTGPGSTLYRCREIQPIELADDASADDKLLALVDAMIESGVKPPKGVNWTMDDAGRVITFSRKIAQFGLIPKQLWGGFVFVPKAE